jgi:riboflavin biosynthesis pyrimidine reductase
MTFRVLVGPQTDDLAELYAVPSRPWLRVNMVSTVDGAATGESGKSGSINNAPDKQVFHLLRSRADAVLVGAGTARIEGYRPTDRPVVVISRRAEVPDSLRGAAAGSVVMATFESAPFVDAARAELGADQVVTAGRDAVDLAVLKSALAERGWGELLCEGGPHLLRDLLAAGVVDELCCTTVPRVIGAEHPRILQGPPVDVPLRLHTLLENDGTLLARWLV